MNGFILDYLEFHKKFGFNLPDKFTLENKSLVKERLNFMLEELIETGKATGNNLWKVINTDEKEFEFDAHYTQKEKPEDVVDGLVDLLYVVLGTAASIGLFNNAPGGGKTKFEEAWDRVHRANMQKIRVENKEESKRGTIIDVKKPEGWKPPDHSDLVTDEEEYF